MMRRSRSASSELSEATLGGIKAREGSKSMGNLNQYGRRPYPDQEETSSMRSFHSTPGDILTTGGRSSQRNRSVSESDADAEPQGPTYYRDITLEKEDNESFGFVILSSVQKTGPTIGRVITLATSRNYPLAPVHTSDLSTRRQRRKRERHQTRGLMSKTMAVHVRYNSWYISLPSSGKNNVK